MDKISLKLGQELLQKIDAMAAELYLSRSEFLRQAAVEKLHRHTHQTYDFDPEKFDLTMTDKQLADLQEALRAEAMNRRALKHRKEALQSHDRHLY